MANITIKYGEEIILPVAIRDRYGLTADTPIRIIETRSGILLIPLTTEPMSAELQEELADWQVLSTNAGIDLPYETEAS